MACLLEGNHLRVVPPDNEQCRRPNPPQCLARKIGPAATGNDGLYDSGILGFGDQSGGRTGACAKITQGEVSHIPSLSDYPLRDPRKAAGKQIDVEAKGPAIDVNFFFLTRQQIAQQCSQAFRQQKIRHE